MKRLLQYFLLVLFIVGFSLHMASCDKDDEPKLSANHSMLLGKWNCVKSIRRYFYRDPDTREDVLDVEEVSMIKGQTWVFSDGSVTIKEEFMQDPSIPPIDYTIPDTVWEYRYDEDNDILWMSTSIWRILKLTPNEMIIYDECKTAWGDNYWASLTNEFIKL